MSTIRAIDRAVEILRVIAQFQDGVGVNAVARTTGLPNSTVSRIISALEQGELVARTEANQFQIGPEVMRLAGQQPFDQQLTMAARPILQEIAEATGEAVALCIPDADQCYYLDHVQSPQLIQVQDWTGEHLPLHVAAPGKIFLAHSAPVFLEAVLAKPLAQFAEKTITDRAQLQTQMIQIRELGYAISDEEFAPGVIGFGVPIRNSLGKVIAAFNLYGPKFRLDGVDRQALIELLCEGVQKLEARLPAVG